MKIICPQCDFLKDISEERFPSSTFMATCPKCKHRFRISTESNEVKHDESLSDSNNSHIRMSDDNMGSMQEDKDDLLPPGAILPKDYQNTHINNNSDFRKNSDEDEYFDKRGDLSKKANMAYENESRRRVEKEIDDSFAIDNPWENSKRDGYISSFYQTVTRIMFFAPRFFAGLSGNVSLIKSLTFYILVVVLQVFISAFWASTIFQYISNTADSSDEIHTLLSYVSGSNLPMVLLVKTAFSVMQLYVSSFVYYLAFSVVVKEKVDFSLVFQVVAYSIAPLLLSVVPILGSLVGMVWAIACSFIGCRYALRLTIMQTALALAPIYLLILPLMYIMVSAPK